VPILPEWSVPRFQRVFGDAWIGEGEATGEAPAARHARQSAALDARQRRRRIEPVPGNAGAIFAGRLAHRADRGRRAPPNVQVEPSFQKGWFEVQDEGSQLAALAVAVKPGEQVLDLCAGAGGKSLALAAAMGGKGRVVATDDDRVRLAPIFDRAKRAGAHNIEVRPARSDLGNLAGKMDAVLIDAPCTGTGIWRRRPDSKWKLTERALGNRLREQAEISGLGDSLRETGRSAGLCNVLAAARRELGAGNCVPRANADFRALTRRGSRRHDGCR